jgi:hypothetical protein
MLSAVDLLRGVKRFAKGSRVRRGPNLRASDLTLKPHHRLFRICTAFSGSKRYPVFGAAFWLCSHSPNIVDEANEFLFIFSLTVSIQLLVALQILGTHALLFRTFTTSRTTIVYADENIPRIGLAID